MPGKRDYYEVLGVERSASFDAVKKAYRQAALKWHPDRNSDDPAAEERFKEATEAYGVLSDAEKRALYDRLGHAGLEANEGSVNIQDVFTHFQEMFGDFFGAASPDSPQRGADIRATVELTLRESVFGTKKDVQVTHVTSCEGCRGTGAKGGERAPCPQCKGSGQIANARGAFILSTTCPKCRGQGSLVTEPCTECEGRGERTVIKAVKINIPAGVPDQQTLRIPGKGQPGLNGGASGHLYVTVQVAEDEHFQRDGHDLVHELQLPFTDAALGTEIEVPTLDGEPKRVKIPAGTQPGEAIEVKGLGVPRLDGRGRGDLLVLVAIEVPTKLSAKAKKLLRDLADELGGHGGENGDQGGGGRSRRQAGKRASSSQE